MNNLEVYLGTLAIAYMVPGPDLVLVLQVSSSLGRTQAMAVAVGLALARGAHVALAAAGLAAVLATSVLAFDLVRWIGVVYLIWLGVRIARSPSWLPSTESPAGEAPSWTWRQSFMRGFVTNISNPKALLFCSVLLPQFIRLDAGPVGVQFLVLGLILVAMGFLFDVVYGALGLALGRWMRGHPAVQAAQRLLFASVLIGFGIRLALTSRLA